MLYIRTVIGRDLSLSGLPSATQTSWVPKCFIDAESQIVKKLLCLAIILTDVLVWSLETSLWS
jgi:hypothetical protein